MTPEELSVWLADKCQQIAKMRKKASQQKPLKGRFGNLYHAEPLPEYYPGYRDAVNTYMAGKLHAYGEFPEELFAKIKPNQRPEDYQYMREVYEPITKDVFLEFSNTAKKSLANGSIEFDSNENETNPLEVWLTQSIENFDSLIGWAAAMVDTKIIDGMGLVTAWPSAEVSETGQLIGELTAQPMVYPVPMVVYYEQKGIETHYIVESTQKSNVLYNGKTVQMGYVYRYFGPVYIAQCEQTGKETDDNFETTFVLDHEIGYTPATRMEGIARLIEDRVVYDSVFSLAVPHLNGAVVDSTGLAAVKYKLMYPTRVRVAEKCQFQDTDGHCQDGVIRHFDNNLGKDITKSCPSCNGTGNKPMGMMTELLVNSDREIGSEGAELTALNVMAYISPPVESPKFIREEVEHHLNMAERVLHLKSEPRQSGAITATEKDRDKENTEAFIKPISDQIWRKIDFVIEVIGRMMFGERYESLKPTIHPAETFDIVTSAELGDMIAEARKAGMPSFMVRQMAEDWVNLMQTTSAKADKLAQLLVSSDRLLVMSDLEIQSRLARKLVERWEVYYHDNQTYIIESVYADNNLLFDLDMGEQLALIKAKALSMVPAEGETLPPPLNPGG